MVKYAEVVLDSSEVDGQNANAILATVMYKMNRVGLPKSAFDTYEKEATSGDYDNLIAVTYATVRVE